MTPAAAALLAGLLLVGAGAGDRQPPPVEVLRFADPRITESSGLVDLGRLLVTTNDSGDAAVLYVVDRRTGATVGTTRYAEAVLDVEALAPAGPGEVWAGDIGDNTASRGSVRVHLVPVGRGDRTVAAPSYELVYPDRAQDAEALLAHPRTGRLFVATKGFLGGTMYAAPRRLDPDGPNVLREVGPVGAVVTGGAFFADGRHLVLRDYGRASVLTFPGLERVATVALPPQQQGEAVSVGPGNRVHVSTEGVGTPVHLVPLAPDVQALVDGGDRADDAGAEEGAEGDAPGPLPGAEEARSDEGTWSPTAPGGPLLLGGLAAAVVAAGLLVLLAGRLLRRRR